MRRNIYIQVTCCLLNFLFLYTGVSKLLSLKQFVSTLSHIEVIHTVAPLMGYGVIGIELAASVLLLFHATRYAGMVLSLLLLVAFTLFIGGLMLLNQHIPCTCGGVISSMSWGQHLVFNVFFIGITGIAIKLFVHETGKAENLQNRVGKL